MDEGWFRSDRKPPLAGRAIQLEPCLKENEMPKFMFLQYVDESKSPRPGTPELEKEIADYGKLLHDAEAAGILRGGDPVQPSAAPLSLHGGGAERTSPTK